MKNDDVSSPNFSRRTAVASALSMAACAPIGMFFPQNSSTAAQTNPLKSDKEVKDVAKAWEIFCDKLKNTGRIPLEMTLPNSEQDRVAGYLQLLRNFSLAFDLNYEFNDPLFPEFSRYFYPTRKQGGDNSDAVYIGAAVNGNHDYRISGNIGTAKYLSIVLIEEGSTPWGGLGSAPLFRDQIKTDKEGNFQITISPNAHSGNWIQSNAKTFRVTIRQYFADWENEKPMAATIERISEPKLRAPILTQERLALGIINSVQWLQDSIIYWSKMLERWQPYRNQFKSYWELEKNAIVAAPGGDPLVCYWELSPEDVLIIRVHPPKCPYWCVEFGDCWWETMDYRYRLSNTNMHYAAMEEDGELIVVVSHVDPGVPNWLDCSGFSRGYITYRWMLSEDQPIPRVDQVKISDLFGDLPKQVKRIDHTERERQIGQRRRGVFARFGYGL